MGDTLPIGGVVLRVSPATTNSFVQFWAYVPQQATYAYNFTFASDLPSNGDQSTFALLIDGQNQAHLPDGTPISSSTINPWVNSRWLGNHNSYPDNLWDHSQYADVTVPIPTYPITLSPGYHSFVVSLATTNPNFHSAVRASDPLISRLCRKNGKVWKLNFL